MRNKIPVKCKKCGTITTPKHQINPYFLWIPILIIGLAAKNIDGDLTQKAAISVPVILSVGIWIWYYITGKRCSNCKTKNYL
ncbi:MAG: hypothetical protein GKS07_02340 [Nitrosopumilus sp.]|nr:MAG: hypothetical protein GKS07_02340 [Nitrosopumilus sp.]